MKHIKLFETWYNDSLDTVYAKALDKDEKYLREEMLPGGESETGEGEVVIDEDEE